MIWKALFVVVLAIGSMAKTPIGEMCRSNGASDDKIAEVEAKNIEFTNCVKELFDLETAKKDVQDSIAGNSTPDIFKKYCPKVPQLRICIHDFYDYFAPCLMKFLQDNLPVIYHSIDELLDYVCYNDGERVISFFTEGGYQCAQEKANEIQTCATNLKSVSQSNFGNWEREEHCRVFNEIKACVVEPLEGCSTPVAAEVARKVFTIASKAHTCT